MLPGTVLSNILVPEEDEETPADYDSTISIWLDPDPATKLLCRQGCSKRQRKTIPLVILSLLLSVVAIVIFARPNSRTTEPAASDAWQSPKEPLRTASPTASQAIQGDQSPSTTDTLAPSPVPSLVPSTLSPVIEIPAPTTRPTNAPIASTFAPSQTPTSRPSWAPVTPSPTFQPTSKPSTLPSSAPTTLTPTIQPTPAPTVRCFASKQELQDAVDQYTAGNTSTVVATYGPIAQWCVSQITNFAALFADKTQFNESLEFWDVSNAVSLRSMFKNAAKFKYVDRTNGLLVIDFCFRFINRLTPISLPAANHYQRGMWSAFKILSLPLKGPTHLIHPWMAGTQHRQRHSEGCLPMPHRFDKASITSKQAK